MSRASRVRHTARAGDRSPSAPCRWRSRRRRARSRARTVGPRERGRTTAWEARRIRALPRAVGHGDRSRASRGVEARRVGKRRPRAASFSETLQDLLPAPHTGEPERDPAVEIDPLKRKVRRAALRPPRIGQVLLGRVRDGARPQEEGEPARPDDSRCQRPEEQSALVEHTLPAGLDSVDHKPSVSRIGIVDPVLTSARSRETRRLTGSAETDRTAVDSS